MTNKLSVLAGCGFLGLMLVSGAASADPADEVVKNATQANTDLKTITEAIAKVQGCTPKMGPIKKKNRIVEKAKQDYKGDVSQVWDACRSTVVCEKNAAVVATAAVVGSEGNQFKTGAGAVSVTVTRVKDRWSSPNFVHYRDYLLNVKMKNNATCEIQVSSAPMVKAKGTVGHELYEEMRTTDTSTKTDTDDADVREMVDEYMSLISQSQALYDAAFAKGQ
jgi:hypothetical protein